MGNGDPVDHPTGWQQVRLIPNVFDRLFPGSPPHAGEAVTVHTAALRAYAGRAHSAATDLHASSTQLGKAGAALDGAGAGLAATTAAAKVFDVVCVIDGERARILAEAAGAEIVPNRAEAVLWVRRNAAEGDRVLVKGSLWRARTMDGSIRKGSRIRVRAVEGLILRVEPESD